MIETNSRLEEGILITYGQDSEGQMKSTYLKLWEVSDVLDYSRISTFLTTQNVRSPCCWAPSATLNC